MAHTRLVTVFAGPLWQVDLLNGLLEGEEIPTHRPDHNTKVVDPFITGANPLQARLQVREVDAERALEILEAQRLATEEAADAEDDDELDPQAEIEMLAHRTRWSVLFTLMIVFLALPFTLFYGVNYLLACRTYGLKAARHKETLILFWFSIVAFALVAWGIFVGYGLG